MCKEKKIWKNKKNMTTGITLVALIVTIVVLLILAGITITYVFGENSIFKQASEAKEKTTMAKAREKLELVLLVDATTEKRTNPEYNQDDFLNAMILKRIQSSEIKGDIAIIDGFAFKLDRSVPKIGQSLGEADKLVFPTVNVTAELAEDKKSATINITAIEKNNGINKIEIWLLGEKLKEYIYDNIKTEITIQPSYIVTQNGNYNIKVYGDLWVSETIEVKGIVSSVIFEPNGNNEWKKAHSAKVKIQETEDTVIKAKYCWTNSVTEPVDKQFLEEQIFKSGDSITKNGITGKYYLWIMLETQQNEKVKWRSEGFNFDNQGPTVIPSYTAVDYSSFKLKANANDNNSGVYEYEFYVNGALRKKITLDKVKVIDEQEITVANAKYGDNSCYVIVKDKLGNTTRQDITAKTQLDSQGPTISTFMVEKYSIDGITLSATAQDTETGIVKFEFYIDGLLKSNYTQTMTATTASVTKTVNITGLTTGNHTCMVKVYDSKNNSNTSSKSENTKLYAWSEEYLVDKNIWTIKNEQNSFSYFGWDDSKRYKIFSSKPEHDSIHGGWKMNGVEWLSCVAAKEQTQAGYWVMMESTDSQTHENFFWLIHCRENEEEYRFQGSSSCVSMKTGTERWQQRGNSLHYR